MVVSEYRIAEVELTYKPSVPYKDRKKLRSSNEVDKLLRVIIGDRMEYKELFVVLYVDKAGHMSGYNVHATGGIDGCQVDIRQILQGALLTNSTAIIIAHNHPSGNLNPSWQDLSLTNSIQKAYETLQIRLVDHILITSESYHSFKDNAEL